jgi:enoyl-CoA hydratase/carnithine racemase
VADSTVHATLHDHILLVELNGPGGFPRLTRSVLAQLRDQVTRAAADASIGAVVLTGTDSCFAAGADLSEVGELTPLEATRFSALGQNLMRAIERSAKPIVAAIRGHCLGGGFDLAIACHLRVAASNAVFRHPGPTLGIITGWGGTQRLPRIASPSGRGLISEALLSVISLTASEAHRAGIVHRIALPAETLATALALARSLIEKQESAH